MPPTSLRLAMIDADEQCARAVARRLHGEIVIAHLNGSPVEDWLEKCDAVAFLGASTDFEVVLRCLQSNKPVLVASESCLSSEALQPLCTADNAFGAYFEVGNSIHSLPSRRLIWDQLEAGKLGEPGMIRVHRWHSEQHRGPLLAAGLPRHALNEINLVVRCYGESPERVFASRLLDHSGCAIHLGFARGRMALLDFATSMPDGDSYSSFSIIGSRGAAYADDHENVQLLYRGGAPRALCVGETENPTATMVLGFVSGLSRRLAESSSHDQRCNWRSASEWIDCLAILDAILESFETRQAVTPRYPR